MINRIWKTLLATTLSCSLVATPVLAAPTVDSLQQKKAAAQSEANALQSQLVELLDKIGQLEEDLIETGEKINQAEVDLKAAKKLEKEQYSSMKLRIKYMYENGSTDIFETLFSAESFSDLLNKATYVAEVHSYDRNQLQEYVENKEKIKSLKKELVEEQSEMQDMQKEYEKQEETLSTTLETKREEIAGFDAQIQAAAEEAARLAAERERQKAEEAANNAQNDENQEASSNSDDNGSSNNSGSTTTQGNSNASNSTPAPKPQPAPQPAPKPTGGNTAVAQTIINAAYGQLGVPYVYGGSSSSGWDCSGLVQYCHRVAGISLPRTSGAQGGCGVAVSSPQPGDIVCYGYHVGIYIGGGQMIHAPKPGDRVKVAPVFGSPWYRRCW